MANELFTSDGKRKYLTAEERERFLAAAAEHHRGEVRTFCMVMAYTGCRISEALQLTADRVDFSARAITFQTLKQRGQVRKCFQNTEIFLSPLVSTKALLGIYD